MVVTGLEVVVADEVLELALELSCANTTTWTNDKMVIIISEK